MIILLLKSTQPGLFDHLVRVKAHTKKDGTAVAAHIAHRKVRVEAKEPPKQPGLFDGPPSKAEVVHEPSAPKPEAVEESKPEPKVTKPKPKPEPKEPEFEDAEDRQDLAEAMAEDPHGEKAKALIDKIAAKTAPQPAEAADDLDPSSPNYRYRDTGYVAGSRKEMAATMIRSMAKKGEHVRVTDVDWDSLEENPREAKELITKANLFGEVDWDGIKAAGMDPGAGFLVSRVFASVGTAPAADTPESRRDFALAIDTLRDRMEACRTVEDVTAALDQMHAEREGDFLNEEEARLYAKASEMALEEYAKVRAHDDHVGEIGKRLSALRNEAWKHERDLEARRRRGWKVDEGAEALVAGMKAEESKLLAELAAYKTENQMDAIVHKDNAPGVYSSRFEYPYKDNYNKASQAVRRIKELARLRNKAENPLTRAWNALGDGFNNVLNYRSFKGSDAFAKHVATVKAGRVNTWDWLDQKREVKGATKRSTAFQLIVADDFEREGGVDPKVDSTAELKKRFNLREVQSGNWVLDDPNSAKFHVEACAGAFSDLADILGFDADKVSFNGRLAMAFGARGKGTAKAHYEPVHRVINITKMAGAGSLAHEWFHCVDNLVSEAMTGVPSSQDDFATETGIDHPELASAFRGLVQAMMSGPHRRREAITYTEAEERWAGQNMAFGLSGGVKGEISRAPDMQAAVDAVDRAFARGAFGNVEKRKAKTARDNWRKIALIHHGKNDSRRIEYETGPGMSSFMLDSIELDQGQSGKYWSQPKEMAARAFSGWIEDKLHAADRKNTYLVADCNNGAYAARGVPYRPFPDREERQAVNAAFEKLFDLFRRDDVLAKAESLFETSHDL